MTLSAFLMFLYFAVLLFAVWCAFDSFEQTEYGCVWLFLLIAAPIPVIPIYLFMRYYANRPTPKSVKLQHQLERERRHSVSLSTEMDKARFIESSMQGGGTLYAPGHSGVQQNGFKHFTDERSERLMREGRYEEAFDRLIEMYQMAEQDSDGRAMDTYKYYLYEIPDGPAMIQDWKQQKRQAGKKPAMPAQMKQQNGEPTEADDEDSSLENVPRGKRSRKGKRRGELDTPF